MGDSVVGRAHERFERSGAGRRSTVRPELGNRHVRHCLHQLGRPLGQHPRRLTAVSRVSGYIVKVRWLRADGTWAAWTDPVSTSPSTGITTTTYTDDNSGPSDLTFQYAVAGYRGTGWYSDRTLTNTRTISNGVCS